MKVILVARGLERPRAVAELRRRRAAADVRIRWRVGPHVPIRVRAGLARARVLEPRVLIRRVVEHEVEHHPDVALVRGGDERVERREVAVIGIDISIIRDVVSGVLERGRHDGHEPDGVDAEVLQVVELRREPREIADAVAVRVLERAHVHLVKHGVSIPIRPGQERVGRGLLLGCWMRRRRGWRRLRATGDDESDREHATHGRIIAKKFDEPGTIARR